MAQLNSALFVPVLLLGLIAAVLSIVGSVVGSRGNSDRGDLFADLGFGAALLAGVYVVVLFLIVLVGNNDLIYDAFVNIIVVAVFFLLLLGLFFGVVQLLTSSGRRGKQRVTPGDD